MEYTFSIQTHRIQPLIDELGEKIKIISQDKEWTKLEVTITDAFDVMRVFHAGCKVGSDTALGYFTEKNKV